MRRRSKRVIERFRMICYREESGQKRVVTVREPLMHKAVVPTIDASGRFGQIVYVWNGRDMTMSGLPLYS